MKNVPLKMPNMVEYKDDPNPDRPRYFTRHAQPLPTKRKRDALLERHAELQPAIKIMWRYLQKKHMTGGGVQGWIHEAATLRKLLHDHWTHPTLPMTVGERAARALWRVWHYEDSPWHEATARVPVCPLVLPHGAFKLEPPTEARSNTWWLTVGDLAIPVVLDANTRRMIERGTVEVREVALLEKEISYRRRKRFEKKYLKRGAFALHDGKLLTLALVLRRPADRPTSVAGGPADTPKERTYYDAEHDRLRGVSDEVRHEYLTNWLTTRAQWKARILERRSRALFRAGQRWLLQTTAPDVLAHAVATFPTTSHTHTQVMYFDSL